MQVPGKFSDEKPTEIIKEVISLKPKMYSVQTEKLVCKKKHICVEDCFVESEICERVHKCNEECSSGHKVTISIISIYTIKNVKL